jgi:putative transposase
VPTIACPSLTLAGHMGARRPPALPQMPTIACQSLTRTLDLPLQDTACAAYHRQAMPNYLRVRTGSTYFFTLVARNRRPILCHELIRRSLRTAIANVRIARPFSIDAWVSMPDHLHCIWTLPEGDSDYSTRWSLIKRSVSRFTSELALDTGTRSASARKHRESTIWQRRFWEHLIRNDEDMERHIEYIHYNPVRHGYVERAVDWPYSSIHRYIDAGLCPANWAGGANKDWGDFE